MGRSKATPEATGESALVPALQQLGFSGYEARCYVGLLGREPQTGYAVAKTTEVPQPKVYEALRKLVARGAAYELAGSPTRFLPTPPERLLDQLEAGVTAQVDEARRAAAAIVDPGAAEIELLTSLTAWPGIVHAATGLVERSERRIYVSASSAQLAEIAVALTAAADRGVSIVALAFGPVPFQHDAIRVFRHASTEGVIYRSHQARHLAVIADSAAAVWALANDGRAWSAIETGNQLVIAALKGFIRHDIDMQQVFEDFGPDLVRRYGPGLEALERYRQVDPPATCSTDATAEEAG